jgi:plastocyanin
MIKAQPRGEHSVRICLSLCLLGLASALFAQDSDRKTVPVSAALQGATTAAGTSPPPVTSVKDPLLTSPASPPTEAVRPVSTGVTAPPASAAASGVIHGQISLSSGGRPLRSDEAVDAVVYFRPDTPIPVVVPATPFVITTERKTFVPRVLPIPVGASVRFPNNDPILHNVFSSAKEASFDLGLYGRSEGESYRFTQPAVVRVFCNVHHAMVAHVLVMDTPFFTKPDAQGRFRLVGIPEGPGELFVWHERSQLWRSSISAGVDAEIKIPLELSKRRIPPHLNKTGQPYRRTRPDEY